MPNDKGKRYSWRLKKKVKCHQIAGIEVLKRVQGALCGMECINLNTKTIKKNGEEENFKNHITKKMY